MGKNKKSLDFRMVFSTNPDAIKQEESFEESVPKEEQTLTIRLDRKHRKGKEVSLIEGFELSDEDLKTLCKSLKNLCGAGGSYKEGEILIQGNHKEKIRKYLDSEGFGQIKMR